MLPRSASVHAAGQFESHNALSHDGRQKKRRSQQFRDDAKAGLFKAAFGRAFHPADLTQFILQHRVSTEAASQKTPIRAASIRCVSLKAAHQITAFTRDGSGCPAPSVVPARPQFRRPRHHRP